MNSSVLFTKEFLVDRATITHYIDVESLYCNVTYRVNAGTCTREAKEKIDL